MEKKTFLQLLDSYFSGKATVPEKKTIATYYAKLKDKDKLLVSPENGHALKESMFTAIRKEVDLGRKPIFNLKYSLAAAMVLVALSVGLYFYSAETSTPPTVSALAENETENAILPGSNKAVLTLADGTSIDLDNATDGLLAQQSGISIQKDKDGLLTYTVQGSVENASSTAFNSISTPRGGQYQVILPDGTKVWLNASSSLSYPIAFNSKERKVLLNGEAYFDVTTVLNDANAKTPFIIELNDQQSIEVLGTELNIQAYKDENTTKTTLIEGRVNVKTNGSSVSLKPGQQAEVSQGAKDIHVSEVQLARIVAWKNGYFHFENESIQAIMAKLARWYDVDVVYEGKMPDDGFGGIVSRSDHVSGLLNILELTGKIHFKVEGRRITVMP